MKFISAMLFAVLLVLAGFRPASAVTEDASVGYCEGARSGAVTLVLNGISQASAFGMKVDADSPSDFWGTGKVDYNGYGVSIKDDAAQFHMHLIDSPAPAGSSCQLGAPKLIDFVEIFGSKAAGSYLITTSMPVVLNDGFRCPSVTMTAEIDLQPRALGKLKRTFSVK